MLARALLLCVVACMAHAAPHQVGCRVYMYGRWRLARASAKNVRILHILVLIHFEDRSGVLIVGMTDPINHVCPCD